MADFRKWLYAFIVITALAGLTVPAGAQTLMQCSPNPNNPLVRAEDYTALAGDLFIGCTGGIPTAMGALIPKATITVFISTPITSKLTDTTQDPNFNEALLIVDEAGAVGSANALLNCGSATAPYGQIPFTCDTVSPNGNGTGDYNGTTGHPNVFQGRQIDNSGGQAIQFIGVPIDAPGPCSGFCGTVPTRTLRFTNIRVNAVALNVVLGQGFSLVTVNAVVSLNGVNFSGNQNLNVPIATVRPGLVVAGQVNPSPASFLQCTANSGNAQNTITLTEGFPSAFKVRNWRQMQDNGIPPVSPGGDWTWNGGSLISTIDLNQNVPNALYNTESGIMFPPGLANPVPNPPTGVSGTWPGGQPFSDVAGIGGIEQAGTASQGARIAIQFSTIPVGSNPSVPLSVVLTSSGIPTGVMELVCGTDNAGASGVPGSCIATTGVGFPGNTMLIPANGLVFYEVAFSNPNAIETASINVSVNPTVNLNANPPFGGSPQIYMTAQAVAGFAPFYGAFAGAGAAQLMSPNLNPAGGPIPRFRDDLTGQTPINVFSYTPCASLTCLITAKSGPTNARSWTATLTNTGPVTAAASQISGLTLTQTFGAACTPVVASPFPLVVGDLAASASGSGGITINFTGCAANARFTAVLSFSANSGAVTGSATLFNQFR